MKGLKKLFFVLIVLILVLMVSGCDFITEGAGNFADEFRNNKPVVDIGGNRIVITNSTVVIDATDTTDPENDPMTFLWKLDYFIPDVSGTEFSGTDTISDNSTRKVVFVPTEDGEYGVQLIVTDSEGEKSENFIKLTAISLSSDENELPVVEAGNDQTGQLDGATGEVSLNFTGTATDSDGNINSVEWEFGDGSTSSSVTATHTYTTAGVYTVIFTATDDDGDSSSDSLTVTIVEADQNNPPIAAISLSHQMPIDKGASVSISGVNSSDADGDTLTYSWILVTPTDKIDLGTVIEFNYTFSEVGNFELVLIVSDGELKDDVVVKIVVEGATTGEITIPVISDISVNSLSPVEFYNEITNPVGYTSLKLTKNMVALHQFDLSTENLKIPVGAKIASATFIGTITSIDSSDQLILKQAIQVMPTVGVWSEEKGVYQKEFLASEYTVDSVTISRVGTYKWDVTKLISIIYESPEKFTGIALVPAIKTEMMYYMGSSENKLYKPSLVITWVQ